MRTVTIASGKGGVGKTNIAVNLALCLAQRGKRVLLMDADLGLANVDIVLGVSCPKTLRDVVVGTARLRDVLVSVNDNLQLLPASNGVLDMERLSAEQRVALATELRATAEPYDVLLIDVAAGMSENVLFFSRLADDVLLVTTPEPTAITDSYAIIKVLRTRHDVRSIALVVNQVVTPAQGHEVHQALDRVLRQFYGVGLNYAGHAFRDGALQQAVRERRPVVLSRPQSLVSNSFRALAARWDDLFDSPPRRLGPDVWSTLTSENLTPVDPRRISLPPS